MSWTREPTFEEFWKLMDAGFVFHGEAKEGPADALKHPCWHRGDFDIGNQPLSTDEALEIAKCKHSREHPGRDGYVFCADCGAELKSPGDGEEA